MRLSGNTLQEIALHNSVNTDTIGECIKRLKKSFLDGSLSEWPCGKFRSDKYYKSICNDNHRVGVGMTIPKWIPAKMRNEWRDVAREFGEFAAAAHCRSMKADAQ
jgi:hypothetical protein